MSQAPSHRESLEFINTIAREVGSLLKARLQKKISYKLKSSHQDLVTEVDRAAEKLILTEIHKKFPGDGILSEESAPVASSSGRRWVIDPLDGTANFAHGIPFFCTSIALEADGRLAAGAVYEPLRDELFSAAAGEGAWLNGERLEVSPADEISKSMLSVGYPYQDDLIEKYVAQWKRFLPLAQGIRRLGSAAICLAYVAAGRLDGYFDLRLHRWDMAAGLLLVQEAGGQVTDMQGQNLKLTSTDIVASNGKIQREMLSILGE